MGLTGHLLLQFLQQTGFANPGLTTEHYHLAEPLLRLRPAVLEQGDFSGPPYQWREAPCCRDRKAARRATLLQDAIPHRAIITHRGSGWDEGCTHEIALDQ